MQAHLVDLHHSTEEKLRRLKKEAERDGEYRVAKRLHAVLMSGGGRTSGEIASLLEAPRSKVSEWLRLYETHGYEALLEGHRSGRPRGLSPDQEAQLSDIIESGPTAYGFLGGVWTAPMVGRIIETEFGVVYHPGYVCRLLHRWGFSVQRSRRMLAKADPDQQNRWRRYLYPNIKKKPARKGPTSISKTRPASGRTRPSIKPGRVSPPNPRSRSREPATA